MLNLQPASASSVLPPPSTCVILQLRIISESGNPRVLGRSEGISFAVEEKALQIVAKFGRRPTGRRSHDAEADLQGVACPCAVFANPCGPFSVAVVQVMDLADANLSTEPPLLFRFLLVSRPLYEYLGDPFFISDCFPISLHSGQNLERLEWPEEPRPTLEIGQAAEILRPDGPLTLGAVQALIDGSRIMLERPQPDDTVLRGIWRLLPIRSRAELWPASFAFCNDLGFSVIVLPTSSNEAVIRRPAPPGYLNEEQVRNYPQGRYELHIQIAVEDADQAALDRLLARPSRQDILRLALTMLVIALVGAVILRVAF